MNTKVLVALCGAITVSNALNADCVETDHSACEVTECCGVLEEEGFNFLEALEEYWGAHHEHVHMCHDKTQSPGTYTDSNGKTWAFHCEDLVGAHYQIFAAGVVAASTLMTLF